MLKIIDKLEDIRFSELMQVYRESNLENALAFYPDIDRNLALLNVEQDFYAYLRDCFFKTHNAVYAVWIMDGSYVSALRLEPYMDGILLEALETDPDHRGEGYAKRLIGAVLDQTKGKVYSHVNKKNEASLRAHTACGFQKISDEARYIDGSTVTTSMTLCLEK